MDQRLQIIIGCMQSGKSTELRRRISRYMSYKDNVLVVNSTLDNRNVNGSLSTHDNTVQITLSAIKVAKLSELYTCPEFTTAHVIGIDEAQFFEDLVPFTLRCLGDNKTVIIAGLDADSKLNKFGHIIDLIPYAGEVVKLNACCTLCKNGNEASYSHCLCSGEQTNNILVGGGDKYIPLCWTHYLELNPDIAHALKSYM